VFQSCLYLRSPRYLRFFLCFFCFLFSFLLSPFALAANSPIPSVAAAPAPKTRIIRTADGLPIEIALLSYHRGEVRVRNTASNRGMVLFFDKLDKETRKFVEQEALDVARKLTLRTPPLLDARIETNSRTIAWDFAPRAGFIGLAVKAGDNAPKTAAPAGITVRIRGQLPKGLNTDVLFDAKILWANSPVKSATGASGFGSKSAAAGAQAQAKVSSISHTESVTLCLSDIPGEYYARPITKPPNGLRSWAVLVFSRATGELVWKQGAPELAAEFLSTYRAVPNENPFTNEK
jgi:hypothetical protein